MDISKSDFALFRDFLERVCGILLGDNKEYLVASRLRGIMREKELSTLSDLVKKIELDSRLREVVVDAMTTNETLWFRDAHPFKILQNKLLPEICEKQKSIDIWCAASSTGQEPYSISMIIEEFKRTNLGKLSNERITATDISSSVLASARKGEYDQLALGRGLSPEFLNRYFSKTEQGWKVNDGISKRVQFKNLNLLNPYSSLGRFDIVFCRNVLIYFSAELKTDILKRMHGVLKPNGYLFLGASEALMSEVQDLFEMVQCSPGIIYRKK